VYLPTCNFVRTTSAADFAAFEKQKGRAADSLGSPASSVKSADRPRVPGIQLHWVPRLKSVLLQIPEDLLNLPARMPDARQRVKTSAKNF